MNENISTANGEIILLHPKKDQTVYLINDYTRRWLNAPQEKLLKKDYGKGERLKEKSLLLSWKYSKNATIFLVKITDLDNGETITKTTAKNRLLVKDLKTGTNYVWEVSALNGEEIVAKNQGEFKTALTPAVIDLKGVSNARDIALFSNKINHGLIYRSANLDGITKAGKVAATSRYKIKTEIDLRRSGEGTAGTCSPIKGVKYYNFSGAFYVRTDGSLLDPYYQKNVAEIFSVLAKKDNYPVLFHCFAGRDRTGTLAALLQAFLGADYNAIKLDYELSFLTYAGCMDGCPPEIMIPQFDSLMDFLKTYSNESLKDNTKKFLTDIGVSKKDLESVKNIMLKKQISLQKSFNL